MAGDRAQPNVHFRDRFLRLAIVNVFSNLMVPLAGLLDTAFLGHLSEIRHLAGVALATVLFNYIYWTFGFLRMGTTGTTAQAIGRADADAVVLTALRNGLLALMLGTIILLLQVPLRAIGFALLTATSDVEASGLAYYNALIWGAPATLINFVLIGWLLGQEQGSRVLLLSAIGNGSNVVLDYFFVVRWGWESTGAGSSTAISQYLMLFIGLMLIRDDLPLSRVQALKSQIFDAAALKAAFALNGNILIRTFALVSTFSVFTNLSSLLGTTVLATNSLMLQVVTLAAYFIDGIAFATESFAGIFYGKQQQHLLVSLLRLAGGVSFSLGIGFALMFAWFPTPLFGLLTNHLDILTQVRQSVLWLLPVLAMGSIAYMLDGYFLGLTAGAVLRRSTVTAALVGFAPCALIAWYYRSSSLLWLALTLFMAARAITLLMQVPKTLKEADPQN